MRRGVRIDRCSFREALCGSLVAALYLLCAGLANAAFPSKPIRMIVPFPPGGGTDISARIISRTMSELLNQSVIVDNRAGAGGITGTDIASKAAPDGYTVATVIITHATNSALYKSLPFDPIADFSCVGLLSKNPQLLAVNPSLPAKTLADFVALARTKNGDLIFASGGNGSPSHLAGELLNLTAGIRLLHVPYKGSAPAIRDLVGGRVTTNFSSLPALINFVKAGKLRALATTGLSRSPLLPDVPTVSESGFPGFEVSAWQGLLAPAGTPQDAIAVLNSAARRAIETPEVRSRLIAQGYEPFASSPEEFKAYLLAEMAKWSKVIKDTGMKVE